MVVSSDFPVGNFDVAKNFRLQQKRKWEESATNKEPAVLKAKATKVQFDKVSMFLSACSSSDLAEANDLLKSGLDINSANPDGLTALHQACIYDKLDVVEFLLEHEADINCTDPEGWTPLHCAAYCGYSDITKLLIERGANLSSLNSNCELPLDLAVDKPDIFDLIHNAMETSKIDAESAKKSEESQLTEDARRWLREGIPPSSQDPATGATPLHVASAKGYLDAIRLLLDAGADVEARDNDEWTPLMAAAHWSQLEASALLLQAGANPALTSRWGYTLDDIVADDIRSEIRQLIIEQEEKKKKQQRREQRQTEAEKENTTAICDKTSPPPSTVDVLDVQKIEINNKTDNTQSQNIKEVNGAAVTDEISDKQSVVATSSKADSQPSSNVPVIPSEDSNLSHQTLPVKTDEVSKSQQRGTVIAVEDSQLDRKSSQSSTISSNDEYGSSSRRFQIPARQATVQPITTSGSSSSLTGRTRPVSATLSKDSKPPICTSSTFSLISHSNSSSESQLGTGLTRALAEEFNKVPNVPAVEMSNGLRPRPLSTLVSTSEMERVQQQSRGVPVYSMVHRSSSAANAASRLNSNPIPASPYPARHNGGRSEVVFGPAAISSSINGNNLSTPSSSTSVLSRLKTPQPTNLKDHTVAKSVDESPSRSGDMVAVLATPVTAVTPQHPTTPNQSVIVSTPPSGSSVQRVANDEAEAERKSRARHNRQTRRATQGVTLEELNQAKTLSSAEQVPVSVPPTSIAGSILKQQPIGPSLSTPVGTVSPLTHITPSLVYASSAMASSSQQQRSNSQPNVAVVTSTPSSSSAASTAVTTSTASSASTTSTQPTSARRRQPPRRSTGISQADVVEAAEQLSNGSSNSNNATSPPSSAATVPKIAVTNNGKSSTSTINSDPVVASLPKSSNKTEPSSGGQSNFMVEYDRLYELEHAENDRLKGQARQLTTQLTELQRDKRSLQRRVSELEEETRELERLRAENQRLKDENCALIRVISKLSK